MKKVFAVTLCAALILTFSGCGSGEESSERQEETVGSSSESSISEAVVSSSEETEDSRESSEIESSVAESFAESVIETDFEQIAALDGEALGWGPGGPVDEENRSQGAIAYQEKYGAYDAYFIAPSSPQIYLTFDEGYENGYTESILDTLKDKGVHAVFFVTMPYAQSQPELIQRMIDEGHTVGNHSNQHIAYPSLGLQEAQDDLLSLHDYMLDTFGYFM